MVIRRCLLLVICASLFSVANMRVVKACSGGAPLTVKGLIARSDYVVKASPVEADDAGQNIILRVESYLAGGSGPEYLLFNRNDPILTSYLLAGRSSGGDCLGLYADLPPGEEFYVFLKRNDNGSYYAVSTLFNAEYYVFPEADSTVEVFLQGGYSNESGDQTFADFAEKGSGQQVSEDEFVDIIAREGGGIPSSPDTTLPYPLKAPLRITTQSGDYILPIDWRTPLEVTADTFALSEHPLDGFGFSEAGRCSDEGCVSISPDDLNVATLRGDGFANLTQGYTVEGNAVLFSTTSDAVAVWNRCQLSIYTTGYPRLWEEWYQIEFVNDTTLVADDCSVFWQSAAWNPDGRLLAYSDSAGIWLWDIFTPDKEPQLIIERHGEAILTPRFFSPLGRYLNFANGAANQYVDLVSGAFLPDGRISPDDRILVSFDTTATSSDFEICSLAPYQCGEVPPMEFRVRGQDGELGNYYSLTQVSEVEWQNPSQFLVLTCAPDETGACAIFGLFPDYWGWDRSFLTMGYEFDYDTPNRATAIVQDATTIVINGIELDTSQWFDAKVQSVEWQPSLFFRD